MRLDILAQLHTITQLPFDHHSLMHLVLSGQNILIDRLLYYTSKPFASRVVGRTHLQGLPQADMKAYLLHHLRIAGGHEELFSDEAITTIHLSSGGLLRRANNIARNALLAAASEQAPAISAEHVRLASTEIL